MSTNITAYLSLKAFQLEVGIAIGLGISASKLCLSEDPIMMYLCSSSSAEISGATLK